MRWVILDEADLLMGGSFLKDVMSIFRQLHIDDSESRMQVVCREKGISLQEFMDKPRHFRKRSQQG